MTAAERETLEQVASVHEESADAYAKHPTCAAECRDAAAEAIRAALAEVDRLNAPARGLHTTESDLDVLRRWASMNPPTSYSGESVVAPSARDFFTVPMGARESEVARRAIEDISMLRAAMRDAGAAELRANVAVDQRNRAEAAALVAEQSAFKVGAHVAGASLVAANAKAHQDRLAAENDALRAEVADLRARAIPKAWVERARSRKKGAELQVIVTDRDTTTAVLMFGRCVEILRDGNLDTEHTTLAAALDAAAKETT